MYGAHNPGPWQGFQTMIWPALRYPLPACNFTEAQADEITMQLYKYTLPMLGASKSFPKVYRYAPKYYQGLEAPNVYVEMNIDKTGKLLVHSNTPSLTGQLLGASLEQAQLEVGIGIPILQAPFNVYGFLCTDCWIKGLWKFVSDHDVMVECKDYILPLLQCKADEFIMEKLIWVDIYKQKELLMFNRCRIQKEALTLADIIQGNGIGIHRTAWAWEPTTFHSKYKWAKKIPGHQDWL